VKGENILEPGVPESFKVLVKELNGLGLKVELLGAQVEKEKEMTEKEAETEEKVEEEAKELAAESGEEEIAKVDELADGSIEEIKEEKQIEEAVNE